MFKNILKNNFLLFFLVFPSILFSKENYLLLTLDTVRADHLSLYGYEKDTTPFLKSLKENSIVFENAYSPVPLTFPAHITMLSGKSPFETGIFLNGQKLEEEESWLPKFFKKKGYQTAAFVSSAILNSMFGLSQGFDLYNDVPPEKGEVIKERSCKKTNEEVFKFLKENKRPFFLWVHYFEPHSPYEPPEPYKSQFDNPYDGELRAMDECVKELFQKLPENTTIVIAGDHGEMLGEHGEDEHGVLLYEPAIKVPLIIKKKGLKPEQKKEYVSLEDIFPTFLSFLEKSRGGFLGDEKKETLLSSTLYGREVMGFYPAWASIKDGYKLINYGNKDYLLFNLKEDPGEKNNLFSTDNPMVRELKKIQDKNPFPENLKIALKDEDKKVLTSLGYSLPKKTEKLIHPETGLLLEKDLKTAEKLMEEAKYREAELILLSIIKKEPNHSEAKKTLGKLYLKTGEKDKAMGAFSNFAMGEEKKPREIARKKFLEGDTDLAIKIMEEELSSNPLLPSNYGELASYYYLTKKYEKLQKIYENSKKYKVSSPGLWSFLGLYYVEIGKYEEGEKLFEDALKINPKLPEALKGKAIVLLYKKDYGEALKYIENYTGINSKDWEGFYLKGRILKNLGNLEGAKESFLKAKELSKDETSEQLLKKEIESLK